jgi:regulator of sigma E protease
MRPALVPDALGALGDLTVYEPGVATVTPLPRTVIVPDAKEGPLDPAGDVLERVGFESADLYVRSVPEGSSEWRAGLRPGDRIVSLDGVAQRAWSAFEGELIAGASRTRRLEWTRDGETMAGTLQLRRESWEDELGQRYDRYVFRTAHWSESVPGELVPIRFRLLHALARGFEETGRTLRFIGVGLVRILQGEVSLTAVGGPITMYDVAGQAGAKGPATFVWAMAVVSLNLGLVNLLPIPVLDGGHLLLLAIETVSRRKLSVRTREIASLVGMSMLMLLMLIAFKNDVSQRWDLIVDRARSVMGGG